MSYDTGNSYLCGHDPLKWLARVADRLVHLHAKDISDEQNRSVNLCARQMLEPAGRQ